MFLLTSKGYPAHKAFKDAIKDGQLGLAVRLFEKRKGACYGMLDRSTLASYKTKKEGLNLHQYFALHTEASDSADYNKDVELLHKTLIEAVIHTFL